MHLIGNFLSWERQLLILSVAFFCPSQWELTLEVSFTWLRSKESWVHLEEKNICRLEGTRASAPCVLVVNLKLSRDICRASMINAQIGLAVLCTCSFKIRLAVGWSLALPAQVAVVACLPHVWMIYALTLASWSCLQSVHCFFVTTTCARKEVECTRPIGTRPRLPLQLLRICQPQPCSSYTLPDRTSTLCFIEERTGRSEVCDKSFLSAACL